MLTRSDSNGEDCGLDRVDSFPLSLPSHDPNNTELSPGAGEAPDLHMICYGNRMRGTTSVVGVRMCRWRWRTKGTNYRGAAGLVSNAASCRLLRAHSTRDKTTLLIGTGPSSLLQSMLPSPICIWFVCTSMQLRVDERLSGIGKRGMDEIKCRLTCISPVPFKHMPARRFARTPSQVYCKWVPYVLQDSSTEIQLTADRLSSCNVFVCQPPNSHTNPKATHSGNSPARTSLPASRLPRDAVRADGHVRDLRHLIDAAIHCPRPAASLLLGARA